MVQRTGWALFVILSSMVPAHASDGLDARVEAVLKSPGYETGHWGLLVVDGTTGKTVYERNADQLFCPASVTKLFSTAAALADLGADYRFHTPVMRRGVVDAEGTLRGDLILVAQGDMALGGRTGPDGRFLFENNDHTYSSGNLRATLVPVDPLTGLDQLARDVARAGIKAITGDIVIDDRFFDDTESTGSGPKRVSPIVVNDNVVDVVATPGAHAGDVASVAMVPATSYVSMNAKVETVAANEKASLTVRSTGPRHFTVRGRVPVGHKPIVKIFEVPEPADYARSVFVERLRARGIRVDAPVLRTNASDRLPSRREVAALPKVAEYTSPPLIEYVRVILKVSHNLHASTLPLLIAAHHGERTLHDGLRREGQLLERIGVDPRAISFGGGAGGARADLVTPRATVALLRAMARRPEFPAYEAALPVLGRDGTLAKSVAENSPARGHARAKTGTYWLDNQLNGKVTLTSKALAGYMETASGRPLVFAFFINNVALDVPESRLTEATDAAGRLLGKLCEVLYETDPTAGRSAGE